MFQPPSGFVFMKVGRHVDDLDTIIQYKREHITRTGTAYWGYGRSTLFPPRVQQFGDSCVRLGERPVGLFAVTDSKFKGKREPTTAEEWSDDYSAWNTFKRGVNPIGSAYALVMESLESIDLANYRVGSGPSCGSPANVFVRHRVDKACLVEGDKPLGPSSTVTIRYLADLHTPWAVFLR